MLSEILVKWGHFGGRLSSVRVVSLFGSPIDLQKLICLKNHAFNAGSLAFARYMYAWTVHPVMSRLMQAPGSNFSDYWDNPFGFAVSMDRDNSQERNFLSHRDHIDLSSMPLSSFKTKVILFCAFLFRLLAFWGKGYFSPFTLTTLYNMYVDVTTFDLMWLLLCAFEWPGTKSLKVFKNTYSRCDFQHWLCHNEANSSLN